MLLKLNSFGTENLYFPNRCIYIKNHKGLSVIKQGVFLLRTSFLHVVVFLENMAA